MNFFIMQEKLKDEHIKTIDAKFKQLSDYLGTKQFLLGDDLSIADIAMYDAIKWHHELNNELVNKYKNIMDYINRFESLPKIKSFLESDKHFTAFFGPQAQWMGMK